MIKILIVNTVRFRLNGITSVIMNYYRNMNKDNMQIDFVVNNEISDDFREELEANKAQIFCINRKKNLLKYMRQLYHLMQSEHYDIVHVHGNSAMMFVDILPAKIAGIPVRIVHSHNSTCTHKLMHKLLLPILRHTYTHGCACGIEAGKWLFQNQKFEEIKNGIDVKQYQYKENVREKYRGKIHAEDRVVIGHVGNFVEQKNHFFLIDFFSELLKEDSGYFLVLISDGYLLNDVKDKVHKMGLDEHVLFLGKTTEVYNYLQAMDIFVLPSLFEGFPVVLIEAQAAGLPCLVSNTVSKETDLTKSLHFISIQNKEDWVREIKETAKQLSQRKRIEISEHWVCNISDSGYDIVQSANHMKELYYSFLKEIKK